jgi:D-threo-aldose 1-dehydrogenase
MIESAVRQPRSATDRGALGSTGLLVSGVCIGTSPLASMPELYGYAVDRELAVQTVETVFDSGLRFLDTSNGYGDGGDGASERRIGEAIARRGGLPDGFVLASKADPDPVSGRFDGERVLRSFEESLERLGLESLPLFYLHDPERISFSEATGPGGAVEAMIALRESGRVGSIGVAGGPIDVMLNYVRTGLFDAVLTHNRYTLLDQSALPLLQEARSRGMGVVNAAPYAGGILAKGPEAHRLYMYGAAPDETLARSARLQRLCERYGVPLPAVALQFSLRQSLIDSTVVGVSDPRRVDDLIANSERAIPPELWAEIHAVDSESVS